jgi:hypothetical protein
MAYLGNSPGVASQRVESAFTATSSQTVFTPSSGYTLGYCDVYQNGVKLVNGDDYTAADGATITLTTGAATGDSIVIVASFPRGLSDGYLKSEADAKYLTIASPSYTGTLTGGTGVVNLGSGQFYKDASGNVGIGTSSPATRLHVYGGNATVQSSTSGDGNIRLTNTGASYLVGMLGSASSTALSFYDLTNSAERMRIDSSGNVSIGVNSAGISRLLVFDAVDRSMDGNGAGQISITGSGYSAGFALDSKGLNIYTNSTARGIVFGTNETERMFLTADGQLLLGSTSADPFYAGTKFSALAPSASTAAGEFFSKSSGDVGQAMIYIGKYDGATTTSQVFMRFVTGNGAQGQGSITANGASQAAFTAWSDERLKENISDLPSQLPSILALRPVEFDYKTGGHQIGFIAQEMQQVFPDAVGEDASEDNYLTVTGWNKTEAILVKAIQEQQAIITSQQAAIETLQADVATLKGTP